MSMFKLQEWRSAVVRGLLQISHHSLALVGLSVVALSMWVGTNSQLRASVEDRFLALLQARQEARAEASGDVLTLVGEPEAIHRATATDPKALPKPQAAVAQWLAKRYRVAPEPVARLVQEAWSIGARAGLDPTLILAIMAIESGFNPFAQSPVGAQGLMQVMTRVHDDKYSAFGGQHAAFDPLANLRVGVQILKDCITRAGGLEGGLRLYVGAGNLEDDGGYAARVMAEQSQLRKVAEDRTETGKPATPIAAGTGQNVAQWRP